MLNNILDLVKGVATDAISGNADVPSDKKNLAVETATSVITDGLSSNLSGLSSLFGAGGNTGSNSIVDSISSSLVSSLAEKVGLSPAIAKGVASSIMPAVMSALSGKMKDESSGFSLDSIISAFTGGSKKEGGILGTIGRLFGK